MVEIVFEVLLVVVVAVLALIGLSALAVAALATALAAYDDAVANGIDRPGSLGGAPWPDRTDLESSIKQSMNVVGASPTPLYKALSAKELRNELADDERIRAWLDG